MKNNTTRLIGVGLLLAIILGGVVYVYHSNQLDIAVLTLEITFDNFELRARVHIP